MTTQVNWAAPGTDPRNQDSITAVLYCEACPQDVSGQNQLKLFQAISKHNSGADTKPGPFPMHSLDVTILFWRPKAVNSMDTGHYYKKTAPSMIY